MVNLTVLNFDEIICYVETQTMSVSCYSHTRMICKIWHGNDVRCQPIVCKLFISWKIKLFVTSVNELYVVYV